MVVTTVSEEFEVAQGLSTGGRALGGRPGPWRLGIIDSADITDDSLARSWDDLRKAALPDSAWTEKRLLRPYDILVTARSEAIKVALVPPALSRCVAAATLLVVRATEPGSGLPQFLWYYLTSTRGRTALAGRITRGMTVPTLSARALAEMPLPLPSRSRLATVARLVDQSNEAHRASLEATRLRRTVVRDAVIDAILGED